MRTRLFHAIVGLGLATAVAPACGSSVETPGASVGGTGGERGAGGHGGAGPGSGAHVASSGSASSSGSAGGGAVFDGGAPDADMDATWDVVSIK